MIRHFSMDDTVRELAADISESGINPTKIAIIEADAEDASLFTVVEGNRRLAALRLLNDPKLAETGSATKFFAQLAKSGVVPDSLPCLELATAAANHWIELEHTKDHRGRGTVGWGTQQHTRFKQTIHGKARHGLAMNVLQDLVDSNMIDLPTMKRVPVTTLDRILTDGYVRKQLGELSFPENMKKAGAVLKRMALDLTEGLNVNHVRDKAQRKTYIDAVMASPNRSHVPPDARKPSAATAKKPSRSKSVKPSWDRRSLIPSSVVVKCKNKRIQRVVAELKAITVDGSENAVSMLFRLLLEMVVTEYITAHKLPVRKGKHGYDLKSAVKAVTESMIARRVAQMAELKPMIQAQSEQYHFLAVETFHSYVHGQFAFPNRRNLNLAWEAYAHLFENVLKEKASFEI